MLANYYSNFKYLSALFIKKMTKKTNALIRFYGASCIYYNALCVAYILCAFDKVIWGIVPLIYGIIGWSLSLRCLKELREDLKSPSPRRSPTKRWRI